MKKTKSVCFPAVFLLTLLFFANVSEAADTRVRVITDKANIRLKPSIESMVIASLPLGAVLESDTKIGDWYRVALPPGEDGISVTGYVHQSVVQVMEARPQQRAVTTPPPAQPVRAAAPAYAPAQDIKGIKIMGGLSLAKAAFSETDLEGDFPMKMGLIFGAGYEFRLFQSIPGLAFEINALYIQKGFKYHEENSMGDVTATLEFSVKTNELSFPVLVKYYLNKGKPPYFCAGFETALVLSNEAEGELKVESPDFEDSESATEDLKEYTKSIDFGLVFGAGYEYALKKMRVTFDVRYHLGLSNLMDNAAVEDKGEDVESKDYIKSRALVVMLGIKF